jgi:Ca2+-binding RTX toxin-like protein
MAMATSTPDVLGDEQPNALTGTAFADRLFGLGGNDTLRGLEGGDRLDGGDGNDTLFGGAGNDAMYGAGGSNLLLGEAGDDRLVSTPRSQDRLEGGDGSDTLVGSQHAYETWMDGGTGDDLFQGHVAVTRVDFGRAPAAITLQLDAQGRGMASGYGEDRLEGIAKISGSDHGDRLVAEAGLDVYFYGLSGDDWLQGHGYLDGGQGVDTLVGSGNFWVDDPRDEVRVTDLNGFNHLYSYASRYQLPEGIVSASIVAASTAHLYGNRADNRIFAGSGDNVLYGGAGVDTVSYLYGDQGVNANLALEGFQDTVGSGRDRLVAFENLEGSSKNDRLEGNAGANVLQGWYGADTMIGGDGSDTYHVAEAGDRVIESNADPRSGGHDWVVSAASSYQLPAHVENGRFDNQWYGFTPTALWGNGLDNLIVANGADNRLGGFGGIDTVSYEQAWAGVRVSLDTREAQQTGGSGLDQLLDFENLIGSTHDDQLRGDAGANTLKGGLGADRLIGGAGNDLLFGGLWSTGDGAADVFVFDSAGIGVTNYDKIVGFEADGLDRIELDPAVFTALQGPLQSGQFRAADGAVSALDADDFILFDSRTGNLYYDPDGSGDAAKILFAKLMTWSGSLDAGDFVLPPPGG